MNGLEVRAAAEIVDQEGKEEVGGARPTTDGVVVVVEGRAINRREVSKRHQRGGEY